MVIKTDHSILVRQEIGLRAFPMCAPAKEQHMLHYRFPYKQLLYSCVYDGQYYWPVKCKMYRTSTAAHA